MPPGRIQSYRAVLRVLIGTMLKEVQRMAAVIEQELRDEGEEDPQIRRLPQRPVLFILDELPQLGYMEIIERLVAIARSAKIRLWLFVQNIEQLTRVYPQAGTILDNCRAQIFFKPNGMETAQMISNRLGRARDFWGQDDWVLSPQDAMGPDYEDKQFIFLRGHKPILADLDLWHQRRLER